MYAFGHTWYLPNKKCVITSTSLSWRQKTSKKRHDVKKHVMTSTSLSWRHKCVKHQKRSPWHQQFASSKTCVYVKTRNDVKRFVMTSKMRQMFRNKVKKHVMVSKGMSKIRHNLKKIVITSKTCYDIKEFAKTSETRFHYILFPK